jgi:hypothetical protein
MGGGNPGWGTVFTILLENHDYKEIVGSPNAPYINSLIAQGGLATNYLDANIHPSLPNYLVLISGDPQYPGILDVGPNQIPYFPSAADNLGNQMVGAGIKWRSYQESMGSACNTSDNSPYATKHDPFLYFSNIQGGPNGLCAATNVDYSNFAADLSAGTYKYMWITPDLSHDGHGTQAFGSGDPVQLLKDNDAWMKANVPAILSSAAFQNNGVLFITWDEAEGRNGDSADQVPMIILSPRIKAAGFTSATAFSHKSYLATVEDILGLPRLQTVSAEKNMLEFFN